MKAEYVAHSGDDLLIVDAARASFGKQSEWEIVGYDEEWAEDGRMNMSVPMRKLKEKDEKLINFLAREKHMLPFRHPSITLRCKAPIFVARQLMKHQVGMSWSEESRRYISSEPEFYWPDKWRKKADNVKQGSSDEAHSMQILHGTGGKDGVTDLELVAKDMTAELVSLYNTLLQEGVAPEQARMILPQNMMTTWVWTGTLLAWVHMIKQRTDSHAQRETQDFARMVADIIEPLYPVSYKALMEN